MNSIAMKLHFVDTHKLGSIVIFEYGNALDEYCPGYCVTISGYIFQIDPFEVESIKDAVKLLEEKGKKCLTPVDEVHHGKSDKFLKG